jgi:hypothetical protein
MTGRASRIPGEKKKTLEQHPSVRKLNPQHENIRPFYNMRLNEDISQNCEASPQIESHRERLLDWERLLQLPPKMSVGSAGRLLFEGQLKQPVLASQRAGSLGSFYPQRLAIRDAPQIW